MAIKAGKFVWYEHVSNNTAQAQTFYAALFGWTAQQVPMGGQPYPMLHNAGVPIGGLRADSSGMPSHWACWVSVADVDEVLGAAERAGARMLMPPTEFAGFGRGAVLQDPQGAALGIWHSASGEDAEDAPSVPVGQWCWTELMTSDAVGAVAFYERVFGYTHDEMAMPEGTYYLLKTGDAMRAGLMQLTSPGIPPNWMPYVEVADTDAMAAKARGLGAQLAVQPTDIPNVGRFAVLLDPQGAALGVIRSIQRA